MLREFTKSSLGKVSEYLFYVFFLLFPFVNYGGGFLYTGTTTRAVNLIILALFTSVLFVIWAYKKDRTFSISKSPILVFLGLYLIAITASSSVGLDFGTSFWSNLTRMTGIWYLINLGLFMLFAMGVFIDEEKHRRAILVIIISTAVYSLLSFLGPEGLGLLFTGYLNDGFTFGNSTFAGMYIFGSFILALYYLYSSRSKKWWEYVIPIVILISPNIINSKIWLGDFSGGVVGEARASAYASGLALIFLAISWGIAKLKNIKLKKKISYSLFVLAIGGIIFVGYSLLTPGGFLRDIYLEQSTGVRPLVWEMSSKAIIDRPILGYGGDNFERVFEKNYDNRLLEDQYGNEAWLDKAHNVFVDEMVSSGFVGLLFYLSVYLVIGLCLLSVIFGTSERGDKTLAVFLLVYFIFHLAELQTAFDTSVSYPIIAFMAVSASVLFYRSHPSAEGKYQDFIIKGSAKNVVLGVVSLFVIWSLLFGIIPFLRSQIINGTLRTVGSSEERLPMYPALFSSPIDKHTLLWRTSTDFQRGVAENTSVLADPKKVEFLKSEIHFMEIEYKKFIQDNPNNFRAHLGLADVLLYSNLFGVNKLEEAQTVLDKAIELVPQSPQPYWMKAVGYIYMRKFDLAREYAQKGLELNPNVVQSQKIVKYVEDSIQTFPDVELYFFGQI